jgi:hypothetical protein
VIVSDTRSSVGTGVVGPTEWHSNPGIITANHNQPSQENDNERTGMRLVINIFSN